MELMFPMASRMFLQTHVWPMLLRDGSVREIRLQLLVQSGQRIPIFVNCQKTNHGEIDSFTWVLFVTLERSRYEQELLELKRRAEAVSSELKKSELFIRTVTNALPSAIAYWDLHLLCQFANKSYADWLGMAALEMIGTSMPVALGEQLFDASRSFIERVLSGESLQFEQPIRRLDGSNRYVLVDYISDKDAFGTVKGFFALMTDISVLKHAESQRASLEAQLRESQKMEAIGTLAGGIAHDFNNALATILGNTELARQDYAGDSSGLESLEEIRKAGTRARDLVQLILAFGRRQPIDRKSIDLSALILDVGRLVRRTLPPRISLQIECAPDAPHVLADASQIEQVLLNLTNNAMQAIPQAQGHICIRLGTVMIDPALAEMDSELLSLYRKHPGPAICLEVTDTGMGMDSGTRDRVFEPFFTTKPVGQGTGLGLSVVYSIVQRHDGVITVRSKPGQGTTFAVYLPAAPVESNGTQAQPIASAGISQPIISGHRILYLDDDESLVFLVRRQLERQGYEVSSFTDQNLALDALRADPLAFHLVLTDYNMPGLSGLDVAREVRSIRRDLPVAVASGFIDEALQLQAAEAGVRELIFKADGVEMLCAAVRRLVAGTAETS